MDVFLMYRHTHIWAILLRVTEYYSVTLVELMVSDGCTDDFHLVELIVFSSEWDV